MSEIVITLSGDSVCDISDAENNQKVMEMQKLVVFIMALVLAFPVVAKQGKGKGAGGVRENQASEVGLEKGKAWAGTKEKKVKEESEEEGKKPKKEKKSRKGK